MKKFSILTTTLLSVLLICYTGISQVTEEWATRYNGPDNKNDQARLIATDASGNVIVSGTTGSKKGGFAYITTVKYNPADGIQQFVARYSGPSNSAGNEYPYALAVDNAGNVYVTGRSMGTGSNVDIVTIKYNSSLIPQWVARFNGPGNLNDIPGDIKVDESGNVFVTGLTGSDNPGNTNGAAIVTLKYNPSNGLLQPGFPVYYDGSPGNQEQGVSLDLDGNRNIYVTGKSDGMMVTLKYDPSGQFVWARTIPDATGRRVLIDAYNNVLVSGWGGKIVKYDTDGTPIWQTNASLPTASFSDMALDVTGNIYVIGICNGINDRSDYVTAKYYPDGTEHWINSFNGSGNSTDIGRSIALDGSGNVYVTGYTSVNDGSRNGGVNYGTIKYNNDGGQEWVDVYDGLDKSGGHAFGVATDAAGNVYVTGESANKTNIDYGTVKYSQGAAPSKSITTVPLAESRALSFSLQNYPNPFSQATIIEFQIPQAVKVRVTVYDLLGKEIAILVNENKPAGIHKINFKPNKLPAGTYFYRIQAGTYAETKKLIVLR
jgi:Secretion system C-terminal sorting domain/Beta-propeller repeat